MDQVIDQYQVFIINVPKGPIKAAKCLTVQDDDRGGGDVEENPWMVRRVDHGQDDRDDENDDFEEKRPNDPACQVPPVNGSRSNLYCKEPN